MKTSPKKSHRGGVSLRLREARNVQAAAPSVESNNDEDDMESELPIRGRPSKKLMLQQQQHRFQVKLQPELKTVAAAAGATSSGSSSGRSATKTKRSTYKKGSSGGANNSSQKAINESYVMRLFERSLDLSKYKDKTPLYPICRAWMANQPRNPSVAMYNNEEAGDAVKREDNAEEVLEKLRSGELKVLKQMPQARTTELSLIPPRLNFTKAEKKEEQALENASKEQLLAANTERWKRVRGHWLKHAQQYERERYEIIDQIMDVVCKN
ncbi:protein lin-37 homolog [Scaptodrosophila lebanonensis]|uniref:Protein lin-37 homolog n=1 Tax=Drosophila lebanonensis TaxID=7225 RepID=A0A6J2TFH4_DROLE|nr:protein lin-37 homolog [Scaptodrosophila lebanonensis]